LSFGDVASATVDRDRSVSQGTTASVEFDLSTPEGQQALDLFSRKVVGWAMGEHIDRHLVLLGLEMALQGRKPPKGLIHHSDRGSQYASADYQQALAARGISCSMATTFDVIISGLDRHEPPYTIEAIDPL
jgi:transposase InsO family protein